MLIFGIDFKVNALIKICDMNSTLGSVVPLAMFYVLLAVAPSDFIVNEV